MKHIIDYVVYIRDDSYGSKDFIYFYANLVFKYKERKSMGKLFCVTCGEEVVNVEKHIYEVHLREPELKRNRGSIKCSVCEIRVKDVRRHQHSKLHRHNILKDAVWPEYTAEDYVKHYEKLSVTREEVDCDSEHPFWIAARENLEKEEYERLEKHIYGKKRRKVRRRGTIGPRYIKRKRHGINSRGIRTDSKEVHNREKDSCIQSGSGKVSDIDRTAD